MTSHSDQQPPEPLAALAAIEAEIDLCRAEERDTANEWTALFLSRSLGGPSIAPDDLQSATCAARALVAREQHLAERRRALNERLAPAVPQPAPVAPVKARAKGVTESVRMALTPPLDTNAAGYRANAWGPEEWGEWGYVRGFNPATVAKAVRRVRAEQLDAITVDERVTITHVHADGSETPLAPSPALSRDNVPAPEDCTIGLAVDDVPEGF